MSILINGMDMPNEGAERCIVLRGDGTIRTFTGALIDYATVVPAPPHGDLIERKAICLTDFEIAMCDGDYKEGMKMLLEKIESTPTIIPAQEGKS